MRRLIVSLAFDRRWAFTAGIGLCGAVKEIDVA